MRPSSEVRTHQTHGFHLTNTSTGVSAKKIYSTQIVPDPPKQPLFLSPVELNAYYDIDKNGIDKASPNSRMKLEFLVACLTNEIIHFIKTYPHTKPAGLLLSVDVLLPIYEEIDGSELIETDDSDNCDDGDVTPISNEALPWALKQDELKALRSAASGQVSRLYQLANLLIQAEPLERSADDIKQIGLQVRDAASILEETLHAIVGPMVDDPEPGKDEIAD